MAQQFHSYGRLLYREGGWVSLRCCADLARYYRAQIKEKPQLVQLPMHGSHITVCNGRFEKPDRTCWGKHQGKWIKFFYTNDIVEDHRFWYLKVRCPFILKVRDELGLPSLKGHRILKRGLHLTLARKLGK